jgi:hypothetical protein
MKQASMKQSVVTKAQLARELDCPRGTVTRLCQRGMPTRPDGRLDRLASLQHIADSTSGFNGGWTGNWRGKEDLNTRAKRLLGGVTAPALPDPEEPVEHILLDAIRRGAFRYAGEVTLWLSQKITEHGKHGAALAVLMAADALDAMLYEFGDDISVDYEYPAFPQPDYRKLVKRTGSQASMEELDEAADSILSELNSFISELKARDAASKAPRKAKR